MVLATNSLADPVSRSRTRRGACISLERTSGWRTERTVHEGRSRFGAGRRRGTEETSHAVVIPELDARAGAPFPWPTSGSIHVHRYRDPGVHPVDPDDHLLPPPGLDPLPSRRSPPPPAAAHSPSVAGGGASLPASLRAPLLVPSSLLARRPSGPLRALRAPSLVSPDGTRSALRSARWLGLLRRPRMHRVGTHESANAAARRARDEPAHGPGCHAGPQGRSDRGPAPASQSWPVRR